MTDPLITDQCPYCRQSMTVSAMHCACCQVTIEATFPSTRLNQMSLEHQRFIEMFVMASGSLKEIAHQTGVSYPTVRARLDRIIAELREKIEASAKSDSGAAAPKKSLPKAGSKSQ